MVSICFPVPKTERLSTKALLAGIFLHGGRGRVTIKKLVVVFGVSLLLVMIVLPVSVSVNYSASNSGSYVDGGPRPPLPPG